MSIQLFFKCLGAMTPDSNYSVLGNGNEEDEQIICVTKLVITGFARAPHGRPAQRWRIADISTSLRLCTLDEAQPRYSV